MYVCLHVNYNFFSFCELIFFSFGSNITCVASAVESGNFHAHLDESLVLKVRDAYFLLINHHTYFLSNGFVYYGPEDNAQTPTCIT